MLQQKSIDPPLNHRAFMLLWIVSFFQMVIANWLTAAFRYRVQYEKPISDMCSIECHAQSRSSSETE